MSDPYLYQRQRMVENQIRGRGIQDEKTLSALMKIPRHLFLPETEIDNSYADRPQSIGFGQTISQPYIVGYMTEKLELKGNEKILEIGTGSGYQTAILAEIAAEVFTIEWIAPLSERAQTVLQEKLGFRNIRFKIGAGQQGWPEFQPFDRILLTAAPAEISPALFQQLPNEGILIAPVGDVWQNLVRYKKNKGKLEKEVLIAVSFVPLVEG